MKSQWLDGHRLLAAPRHPQAFMGYCKIGKTLSQQLAPHLIQILQIWTDPLVCCEGTLHMCYL